MTKKKNPVGPPTKYKEIYPEKLLEYFKVEYTPYKEVVASAGKAIEITKNKLTKFPTLEGFCAEIMISTSTLHEWIKIYPKLSDAYKVCKQRQKQFLVQGGLNGEYNSNFAKFVAINCTDMVDKSEVKNENEHTVKEYGLAFNLSKTPEEVAAINEAKKDDK
tara:strand:+ start:7738 stop:8223 length:486 start_codon:yes stop_codon:yes gene_type:complete